MLATSVFIRLCLWATVTPTSAVLRGSIASAHLSTEKVTPVEKVIELLKNLQTQLEGESKEEAAQYDKYACFCKEQLDAKVYAIEKSDEKLTKLSTQINELSADISDRNEAISALAQKVSNLELEIKQAAEKRDVSHQGYVAKEKDVSDAIAAIKDAIAALEASKAELKDAKLDLVQLRALGSRLLGALGVMAVRPSDGQVKTVTKLAQLSQEPVTYEYQSNDIIATLQELLKQFTKNKKDLDLTEFEEQAAFDSRDLDTKNEKKFAEEEKVENEKIVEYKTEVMHEHMDDKTEETKQRDADLQFEEVLKKDCEEKATLWDQRSSTRQAELTAIAEALEILTSKVAGTYSANEKLVDLQILNSNASKTSQLRQAVTPIASSKVSFFLQLRGAEGEASGVTLARKAVLLVSDSAKRLNSQLLATVAVRAAAAEDHFVKVRSIIKDIIAKLAAVAKEEQDSKSFCDKSMKKSIDARDEANQEIESLSGEKARKEAEKESTVQEIAELSKAIAELKKGLLEATELRQAESEENNQQIATAKEGTSAVELALKVLSEFYSTASTALAQTGYVPPNSDREGKTVGDLAPEIFDGKYKGDQAASKGIMGLLEVILSDFERTVDTVTEEERTEQQAFDTMKKDTEESIHEKETAKDHKEALVVSLTDSIIELETSLKEQAGLLDSALESLADLKAKCVEGEESYAERVSKRQAEIEALKSALQILEDWKN